MAYSLVGIIAIGVHLLVNIDVIIKLRGKKRFPGELFYLFFLISVIAYHITDAIWGFLYDAKLVIPLFIDTSVYFVAMASSILLWGFFIYKYLGNKKNDRIIIFVGLGVFLLQFIAIVINIFLPIIFTIEKDTCEYNAAWGRYVMLTVQLAMYLIIAVLTLIVCLRYKGSRRRHNFAITLFSLFMTIFITLQVFFPLLPMYSIGYLAGITALHSFVIRDEFVTQENELEYAKKQINIDPLTGVLSKHAYIDCEASIDKRINEGTMYEFAMIIFDLNDLKRINDKFGHEVGDKYIVKSTRLIAEFFNGCPIYRIGGDEFAVLLFKEHYENRTANFENFNTAIDQRIAAGDILAVSAGISEYNQGKDTTILQVFRRADKAMYERKHVLKEERKSAASKK